jgi:DNA gyrase inhibitor GyrI
MKREARISAEGEIAFETIVFAPMRVALYRYVGERPADGAYDGLFRWIAEKGLLVTAGQPRFFGFNNPSPTEGNPVYGFEAWVTVDDAVESNDVVTIKRVAGGLYAFIKTGSIDSAWRLVHERFGPWTEAKGYEYDSERQWLEEHFPDPEDLSEAVRIGREPSWIGFGVLLPIRPAGESRRAQD